MSAELNQLNEHLGDLELFMASRAHVGFIAARRAEIQDIEGRILLLVPDTSISIALQNQARGELDYAKAMLTTFEEARELLKARISATTDRENNDASNTKV